MAGPSRTEDPANIRMYNLLPDHVGCVRDE